MLMYNRHRLVMYVVCKVKCWLASKIWCSHHGNRSCCISTLATQWKTIALGGAPNRLLKYFLPFFANTIQQNTILTFWNQLQKFLNISFYTLLKSSCDLIHFVLSWTCLFGPLPACITLLPFSHSSFCLDPIMQANMKLCLLKNKICPCVISKCLSSD